MITKLDDGIFFGLAKLQYLYVFRKYLNVFISYDLSKCATISRYNFIVLNNRWWTNHYTSLFTFQHYSRWSWKNFVAWWNWKALYLVQYPKLIKAMQLIWSYWSFCFVKISQHWNIGKNLESVLNWFKNIIGMLSLNLKANAHFAMLTFIEEY